ncbi:MAG: DUF4954 family protein [Alistipes sp.]|nr:DUF4954 family protein [Alistipes sp.]
MCKLRHITADERLALQAGGSMAECWDTILVSEDFSVQQVSRSRFEGRVEIGRGAVVIDSCVADYRIGADAVVESVGRMECRRRTTFGNGVRVATINENGGREVAIFDRMSAQTAYVAAVYRHRPEAVAALTRMVDAYAESRADRMGEVGDGARISGVKFMREVRVGSRATIEGASWLAEGTVGDDARVGVDVKAEEFIFDTGSKVGGGATVERCFVGEACILDKGFTAVDSLFFANSHCENGEAAAIFAGPYTVSHHKSSLLIAGIFSFFNAGSGSNQSNHLFKSGAVHQSVHPRGCKFGSGAYIMSPAIEGPFTVVIGHHSRHHDTREMPFSYLIESDNASMLMPGLNLTSYGTVRDIDKWRKRDRRKVCRDRVNFEEFNPFLTGKMARGVDALNSLRDGDPDASLYHYNRTTIKSTMLARGIKLYNRAIAASLGEMLRAGTPSADGAGCGEWVDVAGQYITRAAVEALLCDLESGAIERVEQIDERFAAFAAGYSSYAYDYAYGFLHSLLGHLPSQQEVDETVAAAENIVRSMREQTEADRRRDCSDDMSIGYGYDYSSDEERRADYKNVRGL